MTYEQVALPKGSMGVHTPGDALVLEALGRELFDSAIFKVTLFTQPELRCEISFGGKTVVQFLWDRVFDAWVLLYSCFNCGATTSRTAGRRTVGSTVRQLVYCPDCYLSIYTPKDWLLTEDSHGVDDPVSALTENLLEWFEIALAEKVEPLGLMVAVHELASKLPSFLIRVIGLSFFKN